MLGKWKVEEDIEAAEAQVVQKPQKVDADRNRLEQGVQFSNDTIGIWDNVLDGLEDISLVLT